MGIKLFCKLFCCFVLSWVASMAFATAPEITVGGMFTYVSDSYEQFGELIIGTSYIAGIGFFMASIYKFKQYRDNPTQIPMMTPIALMSVGIGMFYLPSWINPTAATVFGNTAVQAGGYTGSGVSGLPGA